jgi:hypothetical protein
MQKLDSECYFGRHKFEQGRCIRPACGVDQNNRITIRAARWFARDYGNTYHSVTLTMPDGTQLRTPYAYGYGEQWKDTAMDLIREHLKVERVENERLETITQRLGFYFEYTVLDVPRKKDL